MTISLHSERLRRELSRARQLAHDYQAIADRYNQHSDDPGERAGYRLHIRLVQYWRREVARLEAQLNSPRAG